MQLRPQLVLENGDLFDEQADRLDLLVNGDFVDEAAEALERPLDDVDVIDCPLPVPADRVDLPQSRFEFPLGRLHAKQFCIGLLAGPVTLGQAEDVADLLLQSIKPIRRFPPFVFQGRELFARQLFHLLDHALQ